MRFGAVFAVTVLVACSKREPVGEAALDAAAIAQLSVDVRGDGTLTLDGRAVKDDAELTERTREIARDKPVVAATIHVDQGVAYDRVIAAEHALKKGGVVHMSFAGFGAPVDAALPAP